MAADIHGKNHHRDGSFGDHVVSLDLVAARRHVPDTCRTGRRPELFWATAGGMGLTGVVLAAPARCPSSRRASASAPSGSRDLDSLMRAHARRRRRVPLLRRLDGHPGPGPVPGPVGPHPWRPRRGRDLHRRCRPHRGARVRRPAPAASRLPLPRGLVSRPRSAPSTSSGSARPRRDRGDVAVGRRLLPPPRRRRDWNRLYGRRGFIQYQSWCRTSRPAVRRASSGSRAAGRPSSSAVLKRFGPGTDGLLSFPWPGWTLAVDIPDGPRPGAPVPRSWTTRRGRRPGIPGQGRPAVPRDLRRHVPAAADASAARTTGFDPEGVLQSDLTRRLGPVTRKGVRMLNALGRPQSLLVLGGTSDIALAVAARYAATGGIRVVLAARPGPRRDQAADRLPGSARPFTRSTSRPPTFVTPGVIRAAARTGDVDVTVVAFGVLGDQERAWQDHEAAVHLAEVNYLGALRSAWRPPRRYADRATARSCWSRPWPESGSAAPTSPTAPQGGDRRLLPRARRGARGARRARAGRAPRLRAHEDDRGARRRACGGRGGTTWPRPCEGGAWRRDLVSLPGRDASRDVRPAARAAPPVPPPQPLRTSRLRAMVRQQSVGLLGDRVGGPPRSGFTSANRSAARARGRATSGGVPRRSAYAPSTPSMYAGSRSNRSRLPRSVNGWPAWANSQSRTPVIVSVSGSSSRFFGFRSLWTRQTRPTVSGGSAPRPRPHEQPVQLAHR